MLSELPFSSLINNRFAGHRIINKYKRGREREKKIVYNILGTENFSRFLELISFHLFSEKLIRQITDNFHGYQRRIGSWERHVPNSLAYTSRIDKLATLAANLPQLQKGKAARVYIIFLGPRVIYPFRFENDPSACNPSIFHITFSSRCPFIV